MNSVSENVCSSDDTKAIKGSKSFRKISTGVFLAGFSCFMQLYLFQPILPAISRQFSVNPAESSLLVSFPAIGLALGLFTGALFADRFSRKRLISFALISSSVLTMCSAFVTFFPALVLVNTIKGFLLSGASSVALTYISEEIHSSVMGRATSLYITGTAVGGMSGRIISTLITGWIDWRWSAASIGFICLLFGFLFLKQIPESRNFTPFKADVKYKLHNMSIYLRNPLLISMYILAALVMGSYISIYNYLAFRVEGAPFYLPQEILAAIYLMYIVGSLGSMSAGVLSDKFGSGIVLRIMVSLSMAGLLLMLAPNLLLLILGLGIFTACFFGAHTTASQIVAQCYETERSVRISLYLLFYYAGSSILGTGTGVILHASGWTALVLSLCAAMAISFLLSLKARQR